MKTDLEIWSIIESEVEGALKYQRERLMKLARRFVSNLTSEDILQPNDYPELENNPEFRYEEGVIAGMMMMQTLLRRTKNEGKERE